MFSSLLQVIAQYKHEGTSEGMKNDILMKPMSHCNRKDDWFTCHLNRGEYIDLSWLNYNFDFILKIFQLYSHDFILVIFFFFRGTKMPSQESYKSKFFWTSFLSLIP